MAAHQDAGASLFDRNARNRLAKMLPQDSALLSYLKESYSFENTLPKVTWALEVMSITLKSLGLLELICKK